MSGLEKEEHAVRFRNGVKLSNFYTIYHPRQHLVGMRSMHRRLYIIVLQDFLQAMRDARFQTNNDTSKVRFKMLILDRFSCWRLSTLYDLAHQSH